MPCLAYVDDALHLLIPTQHHHHLCKPPAQHVSLPMLMQNADLRTEYETRVNESE